MKIGKDGVSKEEYTKGKSLKSRFGKFSAKEFYFLVFIVILTSVSVVAVVVLTPTEHNEASNNEVSICYDKCRLTLVETIPENLTYPHGSPVHMDTYDSWSKLIDGASERIDIGSFYWTMRQEDVVEDPSAWKGEAIFQKLLDAGSTIDIRIAQNNNTDPMMMKDTEILASKGAASVRTLDFPRLLGAGIIHTKLMMADTSAFYVGSANFDWRALTQVKELGIMVSDCPCMAKDLQKIFDVYWILGEEGAVVPSEWPAELSTKINMDNPVALADAGLNETMYISVAPPAFLPDGRTSDLAAVLNIIDSAEEFIYISVMDYFPTTLYQEHNIYWPLIDDSLRAAAFERGVQVRLMPSWWRYSSNNMKAYLKSLESISSAVDDKVQVKLFEVPIVTPEQASIPYSRVNHNKYMVTEKTALITTSNWSGDYFINTAGVSVIVSQTEGSEPTEKNIHVQVKAIFERDWNSPYAKFLNLTES